MEEDLLPKALFSMSMPSIVWMEGDGNYTRVHFSTGKIESLPYTLKLMARKLPDFIRIHKSSLVNPQYIKELNSRGYRDYYLKLSSGHILSVSRKRLSQITIHLNTAIPRLNLTIDLKTNIVN